MAAALMAAALPQYVIMPAGFTDNFKPMDIDYFTDLKSSVSTALREDIGDGDITAGLIDDDAIAHAEVICRESGILCGRPWVDEVFRQVDAGVGLEWFVADGGAVAPDQRIFSASGKARSILTTERTALNFLQLLAGTATRTRHYADLIKHTRAKLLDTRKTIPGLRRAQKYAVKCGAGENHRMGLYDAFLIKENHILAAGSIAAAVTRAQALHSDRRLEIEVENLDQFDEAAAARPDWIMLDNFSLADLATAVSRISDDIKLEASGGIESERDLIAIAETGVHYISMGTLTKDCKALDLSLRFK